MDITALATELTSDPLGMGYSGMTDEEAANSLNTVNRGRNRTSMSGREMADNINNTEYDGLSDTKKSQVLSLVGATDIDPFGFVANVLKDVFGVGSTTLVALIAARVETISRAEEIGIGWVRPGNVTEARG
jgi:hypothetical protein